MGDLIERLRECAAREVLWTWDELTEAADELARLRAEVAENKREIDELVRAVNLGSERAKKAERERDELRCALGKARNYIESLKIGLEIADEIDGRVRLDAEEGK